MNENAKKWVEALRSGKYSQTTKKLQDEKGFCCLGVACKVYEQETGNKLPVDEYGNFEEHTLMRKYNCVREWIGLSVADGYFEKSYTTHNLASLNDRGKSFSEIADIIESQPVGLFED